MTEVYDRAMNLIDKISNSGAPEAEEDIESLEAYFRAGAEYYNAVISVATATKIAGLRYDDPEKIQYCIENTDRYRRQTHQALTRSINIVNNYCEMYGVEKVFAIDRGLDDESKYDRDLAAVLAYRFTSEVYLDEMVRSNYFIKEDTFQAVDDALYRMEQNAIRFDESRRIEDSRQGEQIEDARQEPEMSEEPAKRGRRR